MTVWEVCICMCMCTGACVGEEVFVCIGMCDYLGGMYMYPCVTVCVGSVSMCLCAQVCVGKVCI